MANLVVQFLFINVKTNLMINYISAIKGFKFGFCFLYLLLFISIKSFGQVLPEKSPSKDDTFIIVEEMPEYPGGQAAMMKYISSSLVYPESAADREIEGKVLVSFVVDKTGKVGDVKIKKSVNKDLDKEAIRVVKGMPLWKPGMQAGVPQNVQFYLPIMFKLNQ
jgi:protein TonB